MQRSRTMATLLLFNKPFQVLSQFSDREGRNTLADFVDVPKVYPAGRLDYDSEGLLLLTDDGSLQHRISNPRQKMAKTYWLQVEGCPDAEALQRLRAGLELNDGPTRPAKARLLNEVDVPPRTPPIRQRKQQPTQWLELILTEGRNRQARRMTAAIGHPTLRLIRVAIGPWSLRGIAPGQYRRESVHLAPPVTPRSRPRYPRRTP